MVDLILEDAGRDDDDFANVRILLDQIMQEGFAEARAAMHELADIIELLEGDGMPIASNGFPPAEVWS